MINIQTWHTAPACRAPSCFPALQCWILQGNLSLGVCSLWMTSWSDAAYPNVWFHLGSFLDERARFKNTSDWLCGKDTGGVALTERNCFSKQNPLWMAANFFLSTERFYSAVHWPSLGCEAFLYQGSTIHDQSWLFHSVCLNKKTNKHL